MNNAPELRFINLTSGVALNKILAKSYLYILYTQVNSCSTTQTRFQKSINWIYNEILFLPFSILSENSFQEHRSCLIPNSQIKELNFSRLEIFILKWSYPLKKIMSKSQRWVRIPKTLAPFHLHVWSFEMLNFQRKQEIGNRAGLQVNSS